MNSQDTRYRWAHLIAWFSWLVVGAAEAFEIARVGRPLPWNWLAIFLVFGAALCRQPTRARWFASPAWQYTRLGLATAAPICMVALDPHSFACALLVIVAWELATALPMSIAAPWVVCQTATMTALLIRAWPLGEVLPEIAIYIAFQGYALLTAHIARSESSSRDRLADAHAELKSAYGMLAQQVQTEERLKLARELHDSIGHHLSALIMNLEVAKHRGDVPMPYVVKAQGIARQLLGDVRDIVRMTRGDERCELKDLLRLTLDEVPQMEIHLNVGDDIRSADAVKTRAMLRIIQEAATNAMRHSGCANLWIDVTRRDHDLQITARDDGAGARGFAWGHGLRGMRERLAQFGGSLTVTPDARPGFALTAVLPMETP